MKRYFVLVGVAVAVVALVGTGVMAYVQRSGGASDSSGSVSESSSVAAGSASKRSEDISKRSERVGGDSKPLVPLKVDEGSGSR